MRQHVILSLVRNTILNNTQLKLYNNQETFIILQFSCIPNI